MARDNEPKIPLFEVTQMMRNGIEQAFQCSIDFYGGKERSMIFVFHDHNDDMLTLRVTDGSEFEILNAPTIIPRIDRLYSISQAFGRASRLMLMLKNMGYTPKHG